MSVFLYTGGLRLVRKSGVGQALLHQRDMLERAGIEPVEHWRDNAKIIHINTVFPDSVLAVLLARLEGKKVVYYGHSTMEDFRNSFHGSNFFAPFFKCWITFCYGLGDVVLTPTAYSKRLLESYGIRKPIYDISNGIDTEFFTPSPERRQAFRRRYGLEERERVVMSVGHYIERKGILDFIDLARRMPETRFFWFGYTNLKLVPCNVQDAIAHAPDNVCFPGYLNREELRDAYCGADVFAFFSHEETEGIVVLEALSCGTPTVLRDIPVYADWLHDGQEVYKATDGESFYRRVSGLLDGTVPSLSVAGRAVAESRSLYAVGEWLRTIYQDSGLLPKATQKVGPSPSARSQRSKAAML